MDGVLVNFEGGYQKKIGKTLKEVVESEGESAARDNYTKAGVQFWANLEWIEGGKELWDASSTLFQRVCILSSAGTTDPEKGKMVAEGKRLWLRKNIPDIDYSKVFIVNGKHMKKHHADKNAILVDDVAVTIKEWNQAGGFGILHNSKNYKKTIEDLTDISRPMNLSEIAKRLGH